MGLKNPYKCVFKALDNFAPRKKKYSRESNMSFMDKNFEKLPHEKRNHLRINIFRSESNKIRPTKFVRYLQKKNNGKMFLAR